MHNAPSVSYPVGRPLFAGLLAAGLWSAGAVVTGLWTHEAAAPGWRQVAAALALVGAGGWALRSWLRSPAGELQWDGAVWTAPHEPGDGTLQVAVDLQQVLLVRWCATGRTHWFWLEHRRCPGRWLDLRRAVYSRAGRQALTSAPPPAATP